MSALKKIWVSAPKNDFIYILSNIYFQDCIEAIDGVHILAAIPLKDQISCINIKGVLAKNIMATCNYIFNC